MSDMEIVTQAINEKIESLTRELAEEKKNSEFIAKQWESGSEKWAQRLTQANQKLTLATEALESVKLRLERILEPFANETARSVYIRDTIAQIKAVGE